MAISTALIPEFDNEMPNTRKVLERVPEDKFGWKPHEKSPTLIWLASHVANIPAWGAVTLNSQYFDVESGDFKPAEPKSRKELLEAFDANVKICRAAFEKAADPQFLEPWSLKAGGNTIFTLPRVAVVRTMVMNHLIHHRAQLTVYLRMNDVPVPALYGPSADEKI